MVHPVLVDQLAEIQPRADIDQLRHIRFVGEQRPSHVIQRIFRVQIRLFLLQKCQHLVIHVTEIFLELGRMQDARIHVTFTERNARIRIMKYRRRCYIPEIDQRIEKPAKSIARIRTHHLAKSMAHTDVSSPTDMKATRKHILMRHNIISQPETLVTR